MQGSKIDEQRRSQVLILGVVEAQLGLLRYFLWQGPEWLTIASDLGWPPKRHGYGVSKHIDAMHHKRQE